MASGRATVVGPTRSVRTTVAAEATRGFVVASARVALVGPTPTFRFIAGTPVRTAIVKAAAVGAAPIGSAPVGPAAIGAATVGAATVGAATVGAIAWQATAGQEREVIQHIVLFTPKTALSRDERLAFAESTLATLRRSVTICRFTVGRRIEVDAGYDRSLGDKSYEYAAVLEFRDRSGLIQYLNSPDHAELGRLFWLACENSVVTEVEVADHHSDSAAGTLV